MDSWGYKPYVPVAARRAKAAAAAAKATKKGATLAPIAPMRGAIARTFWGKAWCDNLERYGDYANRLPRGRTYVRNGSVIDLAIGQGEVHAQVMGSKLYRVDVRVAAVADKHWKAIGADCAGSIDSMVELLQGRFSHAVMQRLCRPGDGLFPAPKEIEFTCSCPDWASMCKHVAAVLYGVGARLDQQPELLFRLRRVDGADLLAQAGAGVTTPTKVPIRARVLDESALADVFGIEMADAAAPSATDRPAAGRGRKAPVAASKAATAAGSKRGPASPTDAKPRKTASAAAKARPQGAGKGKLAQRDGAARKTRQAPAAAQPKPKRKLRA